MSCDVIDCEATDCKHHNGSGCTLDHITIDEAFECVEFELRC